MYDIIDSSNPKLTQAEIADERLTIVFISPKNKVEARVLTDRTDCTYSLIHDYEVGRISLSDGKVATVSKDGCYVYVFTLISALKELQPS